jgi:hypothetical protein
VIVARRGGRSTPRRARHCIPIGAAGGQTGCSAAAGAGIVDTQARIVGKVEYREGDGTNIAIPVGPCRVEQGIDDVTISWTDGETHGSAAIPLADFRRYVADGAIQVG